MGNGGDEIAGCLTATCHVAAEGVSLIVHVNELVVFDDANVFAATVLVLGLLRGGPRGAAGEEVAEGAEDEGDEAEGDKDG